MTGERKLVYYAWSPGEGTYLFVPKERAKRQAATMQAFFTSSTWDDFWQILPPEEAKHVRQDLLEMWGEELGGDGDDSDPADSFPYRGEAPFDPFKIPGVEDGNWPPQLHVEILDWLPRELLREIGPAQGGPGVGAALTVPEATTPEQLREAFARHGYELQAAPELVAKCAGWYWQGDHLPERPGAP